MCPSMARVAVAVLLITLGVCHALSPSSYLSSNDKARLKRLFEAAQPYPDLATAYYATLGFKLLGEQILKPADICKYAQTKVDATNAESIFYASGISRAVGNCPFPAATYTPTLNAAIVDGATTSNLYYAVSALKTLGATIDSAKVSKILTAARKKDDSALSLGYAFHVASHLGGDISSFVGWIEDTVVQADEVDGRMLQFEGGLSISAVIVSGIYQLADQSKKPPPALDGEKCVKFANYFLSRKQVQVVRAAYQLLEVLNVLSTNKYHIPVSVSLASKPSVLVTRPTVTVHVSNLLGGPLGQMTVTMESALKAGDSSVVNIKKPMTAIKGEGMFNLFDIDLTPFKLGRGIYQLTINASPTKADPRFVGNMGAGVNLKLETEVVIENVELGVGDVDQATAAKLTKVAHPNKLPGILEADYHQKIQMKFTLRDKNAGDLMTAHQAFVVLTHKKSNREVVFVAEPDSANIYKFDLEVLGKAKIFGSLSGSYSMALIVGDAILSNPLIWQLADVELSFHEQIAEPQGQPQMVFAPKPEIKHIFREPDSRPPPVVSTTFTALTLVPILLLFILWARLGINVSNFHFNLSTVGFHLGLAGIFGLFVVFWVKLTMFETLKYLILLGIVTFLCGNGMLSKLAENRK